MIKYTILFLIYTVIMFSACSPKVTETVTNTPIANPEPTANEDKNPCITFNDLNPSQRDKIETAYVLYKDQIKLGHYEKAYPLWKTAYYGAPAANGVVKYQFEDGLSIYKHLYENTKDPELKSAYVDSVMMIYNKKVTCFGEPAYIDARKAFDYYYYYNSEASEDEIFDLFKNAIDVKKEKSDYFVINPFTKILTDKIIAKDISLEEGRIYTSYMMEAIKLGLESGKNKEAWDIINNYAPARLENLEGIKGLYDCAYYENKYMALLRDNPDDCDIINTVYGRLLWGECDPSAASVMQAKATKDEKCYTPPPPPGKLRLAYTAYENGQYYEAINLFEDYANNSDDIDKKAKYLLLIAKIYYRDVKDFPKSRKYALESSKIKPDSGEPYLIIGNLYASSGPLCGPGTGWDSQIVTWVAIDMWKKALSDPNVSGQAQKLINTYKQYMPTKADVFQRTLKAGNSYKVGCWINRTTTIRTAD